MIYIIYNSNSKFKKQIDYVFTYIFYVLGLEYFVIENNLKNTLKANDLLLLYTEDTSINYYTAASKSTIIIRPSTQLFGKNYLKEKSKPETVKRFRGIISIFNNNDDLYIKKDLREKRIIETNIDIVSDIFFMLTRYEEVINTEAYNRERFNRFPGSESLAFKNDFLHRPIVNEHIDLLWTWIEGFNLGCKRKSWWGDKEFAACLTHDVDDIQTYKNFQQILRLSAGLILKQKKFRKAAKEMTVFVRYKINYKMDPVWGFDYIIASENKYKFKSSFYFMNDSTLDFGDRYRIEDKKIIRLIKELSAQGFETGYHGGFNSFNNIEVMKDEKIIIDKIINRKYGARQHYLRFKAPYTWRIQEQAGLLYDTTLSFADAEGFRCGTCFPFKPYDLLENRVLHIWEIPLTVMEGTMQDPSYRAYTPEQGFEKTRNLIDTVKKHNGVFTLLYHNSSFDSTNHSWDGWKDTYENTLQYLYDNNCIGTSGEEIIRIITA